MFNVLVRTRCVYVRMHLLGWDKYLPNEFCLRSSVPFEFATEARTARRFVGKRWCSIVRGCWTGTLYHRSGLRRSRNTFFILGMKNRRICMVTYIIRQNERKPAHNAFEQYFFLENENFRRISRIEEIMYIPA